jgi:pectin methylesterase-like acyl-CoA thioesterase
MKRIVQRTLWPILALLLLWGNAFGQVGTVTYDFRDGTIITNKQSTDGSLKLSGTFSLKDATYGLDMKVGGIIKIYVTTNSTLKFLASQYSGLNVKGTSKSGAFLGTQVAKTTTNLTETYDFVYTGAADTLIFTTLASTGNDLYLPLITVIPAQLGKSKSTTTAIKNVIYNFDLRDKSIVTAGGTATIDSGLFKLEAGASNAYAYNGAQHGCQFNTGNKITLKIAGNSFIKLGGCAYTGSASTIAASSTTGSFNVNSQLSKTATCYDASGVTVNFLYVGTTGTVVLDFTGSTYVPIIQIVPLPRDTSLISYVQKSGTITLNGITINLTSGATATDAATVTVSDGIVLKSLKDSAFIALNLGGNALSTFTPAITGGTIAIVNDKLTFTYTDQTTIPKSYSIRLFDNSYMHDQTSYDFRDGTIITNKKSADASLVLGGAYAYKNTTYGLDMKVGNVIKIGVAGSKALKFLGSAYSGLKLQGTTKSGGDLGTQATKVTTDCSDTYDFDYYGSADTLIFTAVAGSGNDIYLPKIDAYPAQMGAAYTSAVKDIIYYYDFRDGSIVPTTTTGKINITKGLVGIIAGSGNAYGYNGSQHGSIFKAGNQVTLQVAGNSYIKIGGCQFSSGTISVSSTTGSFDKISQSSQTTKCYDADGTTINFLYAGTAGTVTLDFIGTNYIPIIQVVPVPYAVDLIPWVIKKGTITLNNVVIGLKTGVNSSSSDTVTVSSGTVISATSDIASIRINLSGKALSSYTPTFTDSIGSVTVNGDTLIVKYKTQSSKPYGYKILVADNSTVVSAIAGKTYSYSFTDGSVLPMTSYGTLRYNTFISTDGILTLNSNTTTFAQQFGYHDAAHGAVMFPGNSMNFVVAGNATLTFNTCQYGSSTDAIFEITDASGKVLGSVAAQDIGTGVCGSHSYTYTGSACVLTATLKSTLKPAGEVYIHGVAIENAASIVKTTLTDVWDFGAEQLDATLFNNQLTVDIINSWYTGVTAGTAGKNLPNFTAGVLSWVGVATSDRLRTSNTNLTRYDAQGTATIADTTLTGAIYVNGTAATSRYLSLTLSADDEVSIYAKSQNGTSKINFVYTANPLIQTDVKTLSTSGEVLKFVAKNAGNYHIYDSGDKPFYYRVLRKDATYITLSGTLNVTDAAGLPSKYCLVLTNAAGKAFVDTIKGTTYSVSVPSGFTYSLSLTGASGYIITNGSELTLSINATREIVIKKVEMYTVTGTITGLSSALLSKLALTYKPSVTKIYVPEPKIDAVAGTYSVMLEPNCQYTISATGVNDYEIPTNTITIGTANATSDIVFSAKPVYNITIDAPGLTAEQLAKLGITFTNLNESGYSYTFSSVSGITLRNGTYSVATSGLDQYPLQLGLTSNLKVYGAATSKTLSFSAVTFWPFDGATINTTTTAYYMGMVISGTAKTETGKTHLAFTGAGTVKVPINPGQKVVVTYYYGADFNIEGGTEIKTSSGSTSAFESTEYTYTGTTAGYVTINNITGTTYFTDVKVLSTIPYASSITVGTDKTYQTINEALAAVRAMVRPNKERVKIMIDPGNYEEMLVVDIDSVSFINAAVTPSIALANKGVDINTGAVRVTSYYGHGYNYYSMGSDQKWSTDALRVNKENGYTTYANTGGVTTNGSYWNATVVVTGAGFNASNIIFENSYNQYISKKESEDVVVEWASGGKGTRPTVIGNTDVQNKSFVERAAAIALTSKADKTILNNCRIVGRQDSYYGAEGARVVSYKGVLMGGTDYIFGGMTLVCYKSALALNTSEASTDVAYITAAQQSSNSTRGFLMYECTVTSAEPGTESASAYRSKPGELGRPWTATTSEVVFYNTTIENSNNPSFDGLSLIAPEGWLSTLGGQSNRCYEYGTIEKSGTDNSSNRVSWSKILTSPTLTLDGTAITTFNFTKGTDNWDPIPSLIASENTVSTGISKVNSVAKVKVFPNPASDFVTIERADSKLAYLSIYDMKGTKVMDKVLKSSSETIDLNSLSTGIYIISINGEKCKLVVK